MSTATTLRLVLDQNFPTPLINAVRPYLPTTLDVMHLHGIDPRMSDLDDRSLIIALHQAGWDGLIANNYKMLDVPAEVAAIVKSKLTVVAVEGLGHDPIRAVGALLLELPGIGARLRPRRSNVLRLTYRHSQPRDAWEYFSSGPPHRPRTRRPVEPDRRHRRRTRQTRSPLTPTRLIRVR